MHRLISLCLVLSFSFLLSSCGPRNPYVSQQILGEWYEETASLPRFQSIKFNTNKSFDIRFTDSPEIKGYWSAVDSTASLFDFEIDTYKPLHGNWKVDIGDKMLSLTSSETKAKYQFKKK